MGITVKELEQQIRDVEGVVVVVRVSEKTEVELEHYSKAFKRLDNKARVKELVERIRLILNDDSIGVVVLNSELKRINVRSHMDKARV